MLFFFIVYFSNEKEKNAHKLINYISTKYIIDRIFLAESFIHAQRRRNLKIKLKIDTPLFIRVCIIPELTHIAMNQYFTIVFKQYDIVLNKLYL